MSARNKVLLFGLAAICTPAAALAADGGAFNADVLSANALSGSAAGGSSHVLVALDSAAQPASVQLASYEVPVQQPAADATPMLSGIASWYGKAWKGRRTASGSRFNPSAMTAASAVLPLGTRVLVTLEGTARSVLVTVTDRQGDARRVIDLSLAAARRIGMVGQGTARVSLRPVG